MLRNLDDITYMPNGRENLLEAKKNKTGGIILMSHMGNWEIATHVLKAEGTVVRCEAVKRGARAGQYRTACYFTSLSKSDQRLLSSYIDWRLVKRALDVNQEPVCN